MGWCGEVGLWGGGWVGGGTKIGQKRNWPKEALVKRGTGQKRVLPTAHRAKVASHWQQQQSLSGAHRKKFAAVPRDPQTQVLFPEPSRAVRSSNCPDSQIPLLKP